MVAGKTLNSEERSKYVDELNKEAIDFLEYIEDIDSDNFYEKELLFIDSISKIIYDSRYVISKKQLFWLEKIAKKFGYK